MKKFITSLALAVITAGFAPRDLKAESLNQCFRGNAIMSGAYVASGTGTIAGVGPISTVGLIIYNGDGTGMAVSSTSSVNGTAMTSNNVPATFTVNSDCTGTKTIGATHFNFVITP
ncbi:MAG: hypothetical protein JO099_05050, partial [Acidobacteriia bacterium]|nr:hypothetical protein [Terriglobia bacterium]